MDYQTQYMVIRLSLKKEKGFSHIQNFDINEYMKEHKVTLMGDPVSVQVDREEIVLIYNGYPYEVQQPVHLIKSDH